MNFNELSQGVGKRRVTICDEETGEQLAAGVLKALDFSIDDERQNESEAAIALDLPTASHE